MKVDCDWNGKHNFVAHINGFKILMDAPKPFGEGQEPTPKQLVLAALCGCTGMDVVDLLKKSKQELTKFKIEAEAAMASDHPHEFKDIKLKYLIDGRCDQSQVAAAVDLSQTQHCAVGSMLSKGTAIAYDVSLNGKLISRRNSNFRGKQSSAEHEGLVL